MPHISVKNLSVNYPIYTARSFSLRVNLVRFGSAGRLGRDTKGNAHIHALNHVSFEIGASDRVALIGRNGAGKSTLLKVLAGIYTPTAGEVNVTGSVASILGLGISFGDELSGYEVIKYDCIMKGLPDSLIPEVRQEVEDFTELGDYLSLPISTYSSGMRMRLALALATFGDPDVLLMDEGIGAGDQFFMDRAQKRSMRFMESAKLMVIASHSEQLLREFCNKAVLLDQGSILAAGDIDTVMTAYTRIEKKPSTVPVVQNTEAILSTADAEAAWEPICSGAAGEFPAVNAFDGSLISHWRSPIGEPVAERAFVGLIFDHPVEPRHAVLDQWMQDLVGASCVSRFAVECSSDGFVEDVRRAAVVSSRTAQTRWDIPLLPTGGGRWWRAIALSQPFAEGDSWALSRFELDLSDTQEFAASGPISDSWSGEAYGPDCAFFDYSVLPWVTAEKAATVKGNAWIGWDYGLSRHVRVVACEITQWDGGEKPNTVSRVALEYSYDGFETDGETLQIFDLPRGTQRVLLKNVDHDIFARSWRIRALEKTNGGRWGVSCLRFLEKEELEGYGHDNETAIQSKLETAIVKKTEMESVAATAGVLENRAGTGDFDAGCSKDAISGQECGSNVYRLKPRDAEEAED
ncbi:MAG: ABC transporter ATP-binding protein [Rhodospirillaceae bacterium]|jgi:ABC-2 type transport system ATP-binding protein|nr:ABC transporter ATP-binding protein [Rhodospirillaceae bacterium]